MMDETIKTPARWKVLIVEDNPSYTAILTKRLAASISPPFQVDQAASLADALKKLSSGHFEVILLDLFLPDSRGLDTLLGLQSQYPNVPVVVLTGMEDERVGLRAVRKGAQDYLVKGQVAAKEIPRILRYAIERHRLKTELIALSLIDELTGIHNRRGFLYLADQQAKLARRTGKGFLIHFADLDGLKKMNDTLGHSEGDRALRAAAAVLRLTFRSSDILARISGDEFVVCAIDADASCTAVIENRLRKNLEAFNNQGGHSFQLQMSVGWSYFNPQAPVSVERLVLEADQAMYENKRGRAAGPAKQNGGLGQKVKRRGPRKILVIEDDPSIKKMLAVRLSIMGYEVTTTPTGREGLASIKTNVPNLIILDLGLPDGPGEEVCKAIREDEDPRLAKIPILMLTAKDTDVDRIVGKVVGADVYLTKPFKEDQLLEEVRRLACN